jgi:hypothetical protein
MQRPRPSLVALLFVALIALFHSPVSAQQPPPTPEWIYSVVSNDILTATNLIAFRSDQVGQASPRIIATLTDTVGSQVSAIDFRPQTSKLYILNTQRRLYFTDVATGATTFVATLDILNNAQYGMHFDPTDDSLRVIAHVPDTATEIKNYRVNPDTGAVTPETPLAYADGDQNSGSMIYWQLSIAYTPLDNGRTTLYAITNYAGNRPKRIITIGSPSGVPSPPASGRVFTVASSYTVYGCSGLVGFDISQTTGRAYKAEFCGSPGSKFYSLSTLNLTNGDSQELGEIDLNANRNAPFYERKVGVIAVGPPPATALPPTGDAYVQGAATAINTNYGTATNMQVKRTLNPGNGRGRRGFIKFDTSSVTGDITRARLRVFARLTDAVLTPTDMIAQKVMDTTWDELALTWANQPAVESPTPLAQITVRDTEGRYYEFDLTSFLQQERSAGRPIVSLRLINQQPTGNSGAFFTSVNSREATAGQPQLVIEQ